MKILVWRIPEGLHRFLLATCILVLVLPATIRALDPIDSEADELVRAIVEDRLDTSKVPKILRPGASPPEITLEIWRGTDPGSTLAIEWHPLFPGLATVHRFEDERFGEARVASHPRVRQGFATSFETRLIEPFLQDRVMVRTVNVPLISDRPPLDRDHPLPRMYVPLIAEAAAHECAGMFPETRGTVLRLYVRPVHRWPFSFQFIAEGRVNMLAEFQTYTMENAMRDESPAFGYEFEVRNLDHQPSTYPSLLRSFKEVLNSGSFHPYRFIHPIRLGDGFNRLCYPDELDPFRPLPGTPDGDLAFEVALMNQAIARPWGRPPGSRTEPITLDEARKMNLKVDLNSAPLNFARTLVLHIRENGWRIDITVPEGNEEAQ